MSTHIEVKIETITPSVRLRSCINRVDLENPKTREEAALIIRDYGYWAHIGGRHVGIMKNDARLAIVTHPTEEDFN